MPFISSIWITSLVATINNHPAESDSQTDAPTNISAATSESIVRNKNPVSDNLTQQERTSLAHSTAPRRSFASSHPRQKEMLEEKTPLLERSGSDDHARDKIELQPPLLSRFKNAVIETLKAIIIALSIPGQFLIACFYDEDGQFSPRMPVQKLGWNVKHTNAKTETAAVNLPVISEDEEEKADQHPRNKLQRRSSRFRRSIAAADSTQNPAAYLQAHLSLETLENAEEDSPSRHTRSKTNLNQVAEDGEPLTPTRSTRIKIANQDALRQRKLRREQLGTANSGTDPLSGEPPLTVATIKSPTTSMSSSPPAKYTQTIKPPRPLVPRRQPSYTALNQPLTESPQKTLIIDLDETLIHSMAKGGRMSTGHMVEVKLDSPVGAAGGVIGPQVPILYYVHKRPHCDEFLRKVSKWYKLIVFTASVQEYADPVIDWLELERKYFSARYYRQHCTYRSGAYIKDLSTVEPDLSKVMILDNSPLSYIFHEDNAIPIEGWISDPTDNDLLNLIPLFEGLQYTTDVRALLALRMGEAKGR